MTDEERDRELIAEWAASGGLDYVSVLAREVERLRSEALATALDIRREVVEMEGRVQALEAGNPEQPQDDEPRELLCMKCGREYPTWWAESPLWNATMRRRTDGSDEYPFVCPTCFVVLADERGVASMFELRSVDLPAPAEEPGDDERERALEAVIERDRTEVARGVHGIKAALHNYAWLTEGRGSYEWDDDRWRDEFGRAVDLVLERLAPLERIAGDLSDSPKTQGEVEAARLLRSPAPAVEREPVAWIVESNGQTGWARESIHVGARPEVDPAYYRVVPLYAAPPPAVDVEDDAAWMKDVAVPRLERMGFVVVGRTEWKRPALDVEALVERARAFGLTPAPVESPE